MIQVNPYEIENLNPSQRKAVTTINGPLLVLAGAGTGKTTVITYRIIYILHQGVSPDRILAVTFTNKAAKEMRERVHRAIPSAASSITICTFHSLACRFLRENADIIRYRENFGIADESDSSELIKEIIRNYPQPGEAISLDIYVRRISEAKSQLLAPEELDPNLPPWFPQLIPIYTRYQQRLREMNLLDFDDLLFYMERVLRTHLSIRKSYQNRYQYILVDEYQDTNFAQAQILHWLGGENPNLCVVGDDDQSIYGWRGAEIQNILDFPKHYPHATVIRLEENYRSTQAILNIANRLIRCNLQRHGKDLRATREGGPKPWVIKHKDPSAEAKAVKEILLNAKAEYRLSFQDMAVLYRSNYQSRPIELLLRQAKIPYQIIGGKEFLARREIKDSIAYLKIIQNPYDELAFRRIINTPPRGIGEQTLEKVIYLAHSQRTSLVEALVDPEIVDNLPANTRESVKQFYQTWEKTRKILVGTKGSFSSSMILTYLDEIGYLPGLQKIFRNQEETLERYQNILELVNAVDDRDYANLQEFIDTYSLDETYYTVDVKNNNEEGVRLMTVHAAKGLEFPLVIVVGLEQNIFPHEHALATRQIEEERRLFYVAITRAKTYLFLSYCEYRNQLGKNNSLMKKSQFLSEIDGVDLLTKVERVNEIFPPASSETVNEVFRQLFDRLGRSSR